MRSYLVFTIILCIAHFSLFSQEEAYNEIKQTEVYIPSSPAFAILGVNPETVMRPSDVKKIKVDWRIKNYNLAPDLALEVQPLWHFYYKKRTFSEYSKASPIEKRLSTASFSFGTAKIDGINHASYAGKINLIKKDDAMNNPKLITMLTKAYDENLKELNSVIDSLVVARYKSTDPDEKTQCDEQLDILRLEKSLLNRNTSLQYRDIIEEYNAEHWNRTMLDIAFGSVYMYDNGGDEGLNIRKAGVALWLNGCRKAGKNGLISGLLRYTKMEDSSNKLLGLSYRYGSDKYNFFTEVIYERLGNYLDLNEEDAFDEEETFAPKYVQDIGSSWVNFNNTESKTQYTFTYGGDFKINKSILLNFALRTQLSNNLSFVRLLPVANIVCLMQ